MALVKRCPLLRFLMEDLAGHGYDELVLGRTTSEQRPYKQQYGPRWTTSVTIDASLSVEQLLPLQPDGDPPAAAAAEPAFWR
ncbi:hypothetical protein GCM10023335_81270 [Streptomyces siamensis]|uniref:Uncharacterized protein n=1 Tax=Streptomyces siamensis TaxID=1274986 RepID=A0ABP9JLN2_9ACTN